MDMAHKAKILYMISHVEKLRVVNFFIRKLKIDKVEAEEQKKIKDEEEERAMMGVSLIHDFCYSVLSLLYKTNCTNCPFENTLVAGQYW